MKNIITTVPFSRINDFWISNNKINGIPATHRIKDDRLFGLPNEFKYRFQANFYEQFACDIVSETVLNYPYPYISEKTLRPIACKRMFILLGAAGTLKLLQSKGFITFGDFIDESYDQILDPETRFLAVIDEVKKFCSTPILTIKDYLHSIEDRLNYNFDVLQNLQEIEINFFAKTLNNDQY